MARGGPAPRARRAARRSAVHQACCSESGTGHECRRGLGESEQIAGGARRVRPVLSGGGCRRRVVVAVVGGWPVLARAPAWREVSTAVGHRTVVPLRDGTQITLAPKSRLRYTADYGKADRDVYLDGEAYFQVTFDTRRPFRVHTARSLTVDLVTV